MTPVEFMRMYEKASAAHDLPATMDLIDDGAVYFFSNASSHLGKAEVASAIARNFGAIDLETFELFDLDCLLETKEAALCVYGYRWSGEVGGVTMSGGGRGTSVLRREGASWRVVHEHLSGGPYRA